MFSQRNTFPVLIFLAGLISLPFAVGADTWRLPKKEKYYSPNKKYYLEVTPKKLESQLKYFEDKVDNKQNAGAVQGVKDNRAKGAFYVRSLSGSYSRKAKFPLVNQVSPVEAVVSNDGKYFVTFDNWHSMGYGDDVVVIYHSDGSLVRKFGLEDFLTAGDVETLPRSTSSINWGGNHYINDSEGTLVLKIVSNRKSPWDSDAKFHDLKINLADGKTLEAKRDLFPQPRVFVSVGAMSADVGSQSAPGKPVCSSDGDTFDVGGVVHISSEKLLANAKEHTVPAYPAIAKTAHVEGTVIVEIIISPTGDVLCTRSLTGHPLLQAAATHGVLKWKFVPFVTRRTPTKVVGTVAIDFKVTDRDMNPNARN